MRAPRGDAPVAKWRAVQALTIALTAGPLSCSATSRPLYFDMAAFLRFPERPKEWWLAELRRGSALLDVADLTSNPETRRYAMAEAEKAYRSVAHTCSSATQDAALLQQLRFRLAYAGYYTLFLPDFLERRIRALSERICKRRSGPLRFSESIRRTRSDRR